MFYVRSDDPDCQETSSIFLQRTRKNLHSSKINEKLAEENENLHAENKDYKMLRKTFGSRQMDSLLEQAKATKQSKQRGKRFRNNQEER